MSEIRKLLLIGAGGAGLEALMVARRSQSPRWEVVGFADDNPDTHGATLDSTLVLGGVEATLREYQGAGVWFHCAIGTNFVRKKVTALAEAAGLRPASLVDPSAVISCTAQLGEGCYVAPMVFVGPEAHVGRHVLLNVGASVGHHVVIGDFGQLCPGARASGKVRFGAGAFVGSNGVVGPGLEVGEWATVAAASFAARDVPARGTALGVPAKILAVPPSPV